MRKISVSLTLISLPKMATKRRKVFHQIMGSAKLCDEQLGIQLMVFASLAQRFLCRSVLIVPSMYNMLCGPNGSDRRLIVSCGGKQKLFAVLVACILCNLCVLKLLSSGLPPPPLAASRAWTN